MALSITGLDQRHADSTKVQLVIDAIDRTRRELVSRRNAARGETLEAYYEGGRSALAEIQAFAERVGKI